MLRQISRLVVLMFVVGFLFSAVVGGDHSKNTDWMKSARYGVFVHFLPSNAKTFALVDDFDVNFLADQLEAVGAGYLVITLGQNSGYFNAPNRAYDRITGYPAGERCASRDLPMDLYKALRPKGIRLMLYLPTQAPNEDPLSQKAFGLPVGPEDQPINIEFASKWAEVIRDWSERYGSRVSGWWFDGGYDHVGFNEEIALIYSEAAKAGNPKAIVTFNPGVSLIRHTQAEDYTAGELNEPFQYVPDFPLGRGIAVAGFDLHRVSLVGQGLAVSGRSVGGLGPEGGSRRRGGDFRHGTQLGFIRGPDRFALGRTAESRPCHPGGRPWGGELGLVEVQMRASIRT